ncbi:hypothetical protein OCU04_000717 [Sclerotinia nivalis]|uniref:Uncharacterized protein n=1 Tax=Sclerotinia nivalis TaxID=352851 RepID=A0A9X0DQJ2_9HELO|nr:hypothetical protein OCU04_000717 [Sclerotinia nivalis]
MSGSLDCFESAHPQLEKISGASEQETEPGIFRPSYSYSSTSSLPLSNVEAEDSIDSSTNTAVDWPSSPTTKNQTGAADWSNMPDMDDEPWEYVTPREFVPTEFDE